jgi:hypothetical protein
VYMNPRLALQYVGRFANIKVGLSRAMCWCQETRGERFFFGRIAMCKLSFQVATSLKRHALSTVFGRGRIEGRVSETGLLLLFWVKGGVWGSWLREAIFM